METGNLMISQQQCRAARILVQVDRPLLATASGVTAQAILSFERSGRSLRDAGVLALRQALERLGAEFICEDAGAAPASGFASTLTNLAVSRIERRKAAGSAMTMCPDELAKYADFDAHQGAASDLR